MTHVEQPKRNAMSLWLIEHTPTRFVATVWWVVMVFVTACVAVSVVNLALDPSLRRLIGLAFLSLFFVPIAREWPHWRRMAQMLRDGI